MYPTRETRGLITYEKNRNCRNRLQTAIMEDFDSKDLGKPAKDLFFPFYSIFYFNNFIKIKSEIPEIRKSEGVVVCFRLRVFSFIGGRYSCL